MSGLDGKTLWPPCKLLIYEDDNLHHTKCGCDTCRPPAATQPLSDDSGNGGDDSEGEPLRPELDYGTAGNGTASSSSTSANVVTACTTLYFEDVGLDRQRLAP